MSCLLSQALGTQRGPRHSPALQSWQSRARRPTSKQAVMTQSNNYTLCDEEVLWDLASFIRHPGKLLGGNEMSADAWRMSRSWGGGRNREGPGSWQSVRTACLKALDPERACEVGTFKMFKLFSVAEYKHPLMISLPNKCYVLNLRILWVYSICEFSYILNKGNGFWKLVFLW